MSASNDLMGLSGVEFAVVHLSNLITLTSTDSSAMRCGDGCLPSGKALATRNCSKIESKISVGFLLISRPEVNAVEVAISRQNVANVKA